MKHKLTSRKFWAAVAAFLMSLSTSIVGMNTNNPQLMIFGTICGVVSTAIYAAAEAYVDGARYVDSNSKTETLEPAIGFMHETEEEG